MTSHGRRLIAAGFAVVAFAAGAGALAGQHGPAKAVVHIDGPALAPVTTPVSPPDPPVVAGTGTQVLTALTPVTTAPPLPRTPPRTIVSTVTSHRVAPTPTTTPGVRLIPPWLCTRKGPCGPPPLTPVTT
jgi:hypothetical protein